MAGFTSYPESSSCPSLSSNLDYVDPSSQGASDHRRESISYSEHSASHDDLSNLSTPITSFSSSSFVDSKISGIEPGYIPNETNMPLSLYDYSMDICSSSDPFWSTGDELSSTPANIITPPHGERISRPGEEPMNPGFGYIPASCSDIDTSLSQPIFHEPRMSLDFADDPTLIGWTVSDREMTPPQTVIPSAMFQSTFASPSYSTPPVTPRRHRRIENETPIALNSPCILSSPEADVGYQAIQNSQNEAFVSAIRSRAHLKNKPVPLPPRLEKRPYACQRRSSASGRACKTTVTKRINGREIKCEKYENAKHHCPIPGCSSKFKRKEHLKRHQQSVKHGRPDDKSEREMPTYFCVFCGKTLSRSDNLKQHKKQTHGQNKANKRRHYVATCDHTSEWRDDEYEGLVGEDGLPTVNPKDDTCNQDTKERRATWMRLNSTNQTCSRIHFKISSRL